MDCSNNNDFVIVQALNSVNFGPEVPCGFSSEDALKALLLY